MSYPANIAPQTPSSKYAVEACGDGTYDLYIFQKGLPYITAKKPQSMCRIDMSLYDQSTTRDEVWAPELGRGPLSIVEADTGAGGPTTVNGDLVVTTLTSIAPDEVATMMQQSDSFTHVAPHQNVLADTYVQFWSGPVVTGQPTGNNPA